MTTDETMLPLEPTESEASDTESEASSFKLSAKQAMKLKQRLRISERYREKEFKPHYDASLRLVRGIHWPEGKSSSDDECRVIVNMAYPIVTTKVSTVGFRYPEHNLTPLNRQSAERAKLATAAMKHEWKISGTQREAVRALHDKEVFKFGVVMTGWEFKTKGGINRKDGRSAVVGENASDPLDFDKMAQMVSETGKPTEDTPPEEVICDQFYCKRICPYNFLIDPEGDWVLDNHEYCGYIEHVPVNELKNDPRLKNTKQLKGSSRGMRSFLDDEVLAKNEAEHPSDVKRVKVYHYFEKRRQIYAMFCDEHDEALHSEKWSWEHGRYPFRVIHAPGDEDRWYDTTPVELIRSQQEELNVTRTMLRNHIRRNARKYSVARGMLDRQAKNQLKSSIDGGIIEHNGGPEARVIMPIDHAPLAPEIYKTDEWAIRDMRFMTGLDEYDTNTVGKTRRTAAEVSQIRQAGGSRAQSDAQMFEQFCAAIGEDLLDLMMQYSDKTRSIPIYDENDQIADWSSFTADDIKGDFLVDVYIGSTQPRNSMELQQTYAWLLQTLAPFSQTPDPETGGPLINLKALVKNLLSAFPDLHNVQDILTSPPPPPMMAAGGPPQTGPDGLPMPLPQQSFMGPAQ